MTSPRRALDDAAAERLLRGRSVDGRSDLDDLAALVGALGRLEDVTPPAPRGELAALLADGFDPEHPPVPAADVPVWHPASSGARSGVLRPAARVAGLSLVAKVLLGSGVAVAGVTTAAGTGTLPDPVQDRVSEVVEAVTPFEVPRGTAPASPGTGTGSADDAGPTEQPRERPSTPAAVPPPAPQPPVRPEPPRQGPPETTPTLPTPAVERPTPDRPDRGPKQPARPAEQGSDSAEGTPAQDRRDDAPAVERSASPRPESVGDTEAEAPGENAPTEPPAGGQDDAPAG